MWGHVGFVMLTLPADLRQYFPSNSIGILGIDAIWLVHAHRGRVQANGTCAAGAVGLSKGCRHKPCAASLGSTPSPNQYASSRCG